MKGERMPRHNSSQKMTKDERRLSILRTASSLISNYGFWGLTIRDVAEAEHITEAGVLYHFGSKEKLLSEVVKYNDLLVSSDIAKQLNIDEPLNEIAVIGTKYPVGIRDLTIATAKVNAKRTEFVRLYTLLQAESLNEHHPAHEFFLNRERRVLHEYTMACERDGAEDPAETARQVLAAMDGLQFRWLHDIDGMDFVEEWRKILELILPSR
ncbi:transcriptional regulator, TetR family [Bifidobacterium bohemicum]|nr:transcriptional regulator, TetR family [Bifidobacterium bohemicum]